MKEKNILFCINSMNIGGAEQLLVDKINNWPNKDNIHLVLFLDQIDLLSKINRPIKITKIISKTNYYKIKRLRNYFKMHKIDYCFSHLEKPNKVSLFAALLTKTKTIPVVHNVDLYKNDLFREKITSLIYRLLASKVVAISSAVFEYLTNDLNLNPSYVNLIENGLDFNRIKFNNSIEDFDQNRNFFCLGRLVEAKGYNFMIECLNDEDIIKKDWKITMIGDGDQKKKLDILITKYNLNEKVIMIGKKKNPFSFIKAGSIALMPSKREGLPIALLEILSQGIPVLSSDINPLEIISNNYNGLKFKSTSKKDFKRNFLEALEINKNDYKTLSKNAVSSVQNYCITSCVKGYTKLMS
jgi:GalNAc-alpha-(1->4)-GalNAc-alpha-(1->3)-diNAcBac-PP-undecaprenol alpha-1,4-N-acetyl-D-galactosaminyltransferase